MKSFRGTRTNRCRVKLLIKTVRRSNERLYTTILTSKTTTWEGNPDARLETESSARGGSDSRAGFDFCCGKAVFGRVCQVKLRTKIRLIRNLPFLLSNNYLYFNINDRLELYIRYLCKMQNPRFAIATTVFSCNLIMSLCQSILPTSNFTQS